MRRRGSHESGKDKGEKDNVGRQREREGAGGSEREAGSEREGGRARERDREGEIWKDIWGEGERGRERDREGEERGHERKVKHREGDIHKTTEHAMNRWTAR